MTTTATAMIEPDADSLETWQNVTKGRVVLQRLGAMGQRRQDMIGAGKTFHLTPVERRINQELAATPDLDVFLNGTLQPIKLLEGTEDFEMLKDNPNLIGDDQQIARLFRASDDTFASRLAEIKNPSALERLLELAQLDETGAKVSQLRMIESRLTQVSPVMDSIHGPATGKEGEPDDRGKIKAVTPR